jgi:hypothetical protein
MAVERGGAHLTANQIHGAPVAHSIGLTPNRGATMMGAHAGAAAPSRSLSRPVVSRNGSFGGANHPAMTNNNNVARPGNNSGLANSREGAGANRSFGTNNSMAGHNVPRPPNASMPGRSEGTNTLRASNDNSPRFGQGSGGGSSHNVPRPPSSFNRSGENQPVNSNRSFGNTGRGEMSSPHSANVPRPTGPVRPASQIDSGSARGYGSSPAYRGSESGASRYGSYSGYRGSSPSNSSPAYRGGGYRSAPSSSGRGYSSAPSYHASASAPSYHGGGGYSGGSSHGGYSGGGGHSSGGGGHSSGGGHSGGHR